MNIDKNASNSFGNKNNMNVRNNNIIATNNNVDSSIECIKEFIQTFNFAKNATIIVDFSKVKNKESETKTDDSNTNIINLYSSYCIWLCMNEIYPEWFDISIHPAQFYTELEAYDCLIKYINEYHENKYGVLIQNLLNNLKNISLNDFIDIYSLIIIAALVSDDKQIYINNILSLNHSTQEYIQNVVKTLDEETNNQDKTSGSSYPSRSISVMGNDDTKEIENLKNEIKLLKEKVKITETKNENMNNLLAEKEKIISEKEREISNLQKQISTINESSKDKFIVQIEEQEKKILDLQNALEKETKEKINIENNLKEKIKELTDEQNILKQENLNIEELQNKINKYKEKLEEMSTLQNINKELEEKIQSNTQKMIDMETELQKIKQEKSNIETYKDKCADLDANLVNERKEKEKLKQDLIEKNKILEQLRKDLSIKSTSLDILKKEKNRDTYPIGLGKVDQTEELIRLKKENEKLKEQLGGNVNEKLKKMDDLENEMDDLRRKNEKLEQKISEFIDKKDVGDIIKLEEENNTFKMEIEEKQRKIEELTETNQKVMQQIANFKSSVDHNVLQDKITKLEAELIIAKENTKQIEEITKNKINKEYNGLLQILKEQLQIREKESEYYKQALKTQIDATTDEQKLLSGVIHNLGLKYKQLQTYNLSLRNEIAGIKLRKETCSTTEEK